MERIFMNQFCEFQAVLSFRIIWIFLMYDERKKREEPPSLRNERFTRARHAQRSS